MYGARFCSNLGIHGTLKIALCYQGGAGMSDMGEGEADVEYLGRRNSSEFTGEERNMCSQYHILSCFNCVGAMSSASARRAYNHLGG